MARKSKRAGDNIPRSFRTKTAQPRVGESQSESEMFYHSIYENSADAILLTAPDGAILDANPAACQMFSRTVEEIRQIGCDGLVDVSDPRLEIAREERAYLGEARAEFKLVRANGTKFTGEISSKLFTNAQGQQRISMIIRDITERKRAEEALLESERKFHTLFSEMISGSALHELIYDNAGIPVDYVTLEVNKAYETLLQVDKSAVIGQKASAILPRDELEKWMGIFVPVVLTEKLIYYEMYSPLNNKYFEGTAYCPGKGQIAVTFSDVFEHKQAEEKLRESQAREHDRRNELETILNSVPALVWIAHDPDCKIVTGNRTASVFLRMPRDANQSLTSSAGEVSRHFKIYQDGKEIPSQELPLNLAARGLDVKNFEEEVVFDNGSTHYLVGNATPLYDDQGKPRGAVAAFHEITMRKRADQALRESELRFRRLSEATFEAILIHERGMAISANEQFYEMFGYKPGELLGKQVIPLTVAPEARDYLREQIATGSPGPYESIGLKKNGMSFPMEIRAREMEQEGRKIRVAVIRDITERKRVEEALYENQERFRRMFDQSPIGAAMVGLDYRFLRVNEALCRITGYPAEELTALSFSDITYPDDLGLDIQQAQQLTAGEIDQYAIDKRYIYKNGGVIWIRLSVRLVRDADGSPMYYLPMIEDITERKQAEEALRDSEMRYRIVADYTYDWEFWADREGKWRYCSPSCERITGYPPTQFLEDPTFFQEIILEDDRVKFKAHQENADNNQPSTIDLRIIRRDGVIRWINYVCQEIITAEGEKLGHRVSNRDITQRKQAEEALRASEARFSTVFHANPLSIAITRLSDNVFIDVNPAWQKLTGFDHEEVVGHTPIELQTCIDPAEWDRLVKELRQRGKVQGFESQLRNKSSVIHDLTFSAVQIEVAGESCMMCTMMDITERKRTEAALQESERLFRTLFQQSPLGIALVDSNNRFIDANETLCAMLGYTKKELLRKTILNITHPDERSMYKPLLEYITAGSNQEYSTQKRYLKKNGRSIWVHVTTASVINSVGNIAYRINIVEDITERKWVEENIRRRNLELALLNQIGQAFNRLMSPSEIVELLYTNIGQALDNRNLYIALCDETNQSISFPIYTVKGKRRAPHSRPFGNGITEYILRTKTPLLISNDQKAFLAEQHIDAVGVVSKSFLGTPMRVGDRVLGVIAIQNYDRENAYEAGDVELMSTIAGQAAIALENSQLYGEAQRELNKRKQAENALRESRDRLAHLSHRLVEVQEKERRRIAFELHDEVGQTLTALSIGLDGIAHTTGEAAIRIKTVGLQDLVRSLINQVSALSVELHPRDLDVLGLIPGMISLFRRISTQTGIEVDFKHTGLEQMRFTPEIEISAYRIVQEALTNVIRHSGVKEASIRLQADGDTLWIQVQDVGRGFNLEKQVSVENSMGLLSMIERAEQIGGHLSIETAPGEGVNITCTLPLK